MWTKNIYAELEEMSVSFVEKKEFINNRIKSSETNDLEVWFCFRNGIKNTKSHG